MKAFIIWAWIRKIIGYLVAFCLLGILFMFLAFWYMFGRATALPNFIHTYYIATQNFIEPVSKTSLWDGLSKGLIGALDEKHSLYLTKEDFTSMKEETAASYAGIGVVIGQTDNGIVAAHVMEDQPAEKAGLKDGDIILAVDGQSTEGMALDNVSSAIRGKAGTTVTLTVSRNGEKLDFPIVRDKVVMPTVRSRMLTDHIGYIRVSQFAEPTGEDFAEQYKDLKAQGMTKLVLDLRNNPGGLVTTAAAIANYILPQGPFVTVQARGGPMEAYESQGLEEPIPLVVLMNKNSASASEIIAGAVQDEGVGKILGTLSYGKGTVQAVLHNLAGEAVKVTIAKYHTPKDRVIDGIGITPDIEFPLPAGVRIDWKTNDPQIEKAIEVIKTL